MALLDIPVWTIPPDWTDPVSETLAWKTGMFTSIVGAEQRQSLRLSPRRAFEYTVRPTGAWRTYYDALLSTPLQVQFYTPLWHDRGVLAADVAIGDTTFTVVGDRTELATMEVAFVPGSAPYLYDILEVTSASLVGLNTQFVCAPFQRAWKSGNPVFAAAVAAIITQPTFNRYSDNALESVVRFDLLQRNDWAGTITPPTYLDFPVVELGVNEGDAQSGSYFRYSATLDNDVGIPIFKDFGGSGFPGYAGSNFVQGLGDGVALRSLLYALRGKRNSAWFVRPTTDFTAVAPIDGSGATILVERSGFTDLGGPGTGRQDIRIRLNDGTVFYRRITGSNVPFDAGNTEVLDLDEPLFVTVQPSDIAQISFMGLGRLDQDEITLTHTTDTEGVCAVALAFKLMPNLRSAADWSPPAFPFTAMEHCMTEVIGTGVFEKIIGGFTGDVPLVTRSAPTGAGAFDGTGGTMLFSVWVDIGSVGQGIMFSTTSNTFSEGHNGSSISLIACNLYVEMVGGLEGIDGSGGLFVGYDDQDQNQIGASIWAPPATGRHHIMFSVDSVANKVQCAIDDVVQPNNTFGFGEVWYSTQPMGAPVGSKETVGLGRAGGGAYDVTPGGGVNDEVCANYLWVARTPSFVDLLNPTNRRPFINADLTPTSLPDNGIALGITPGVFLEIKGTDTADAWLLNRGTGPQFVTINGGLALCDRIIP